MLSIKLLKAVAVCLGSSFCGFLSPYSSGDATGRMYIEALLFIIYGRAAYEGSSLGRDPTLRKYCSQLKEKVKAEPAGENSVNLMLCAAFHLQKDYSIVWRLLGMQNQGEAEADLLPVD